MDITLDHLRKLSIEFLDRAIEVNPTTPHKGYLLSNQKALKRASDEMDHKANINAITDKDFKEISPLHALKQIYIIEQVERCAILLAEQKSAKLPFIPMNKRSEEVREAFTTMKREKLATAYTPL